MAMRTHYCGTITERLCGEKVRLCGWVDTSRDHGGVIFVDLRDRSGIVQLVFNPDTDADLHERAGSLHDEDVVAVEGHVRRRPEGTENPKLPTGTVEVVVEAMEVLNACSFHPISVQDAAAASDELRMRYRYIDLRRSEAQRRFVLRHRIVKAMRDFFDEEGFLEIETPFLTRSTPEGARDYLVPSRVNPGSFYALPQSPQMFKQVLMAAGFDRYVQVVRCFRDEDLRADRQPEFTQLDLEMSFVDEEDVMGVVERMLARVFREVLEAEIAIPFPRLPFQEAMLRYGTDKPDVRFGMEIFDVTDVFAGSEFKVFAGVAASGGCIRGLCAKGTVERFTRKDLDGFIEFAKQRGAGGLVWMRVKEDGLDSPVAKFLGEEEKRRLREASGCEAGDTLLLVADTEKVVCRVLGDLRTALGERLDLVPEGGMNFLWVTDFPLFEYNEEEKRFEPAHHPFTSPREEDLDDFDSAKEKARARSYDLVLNGVELGSGSIRIHRRDIQERMFAAIGIGEAEAQERFGFLLDALAAGAPPHGGIALGLDRLIMMLTGAESLREVIAFPKTQKAHCPLTGAPAPVSEAQLRELGLKLR